MAEMESPEVTYSFQVSYGSPTDAHAMDVQILAPALFGFGELIRETNAQLNGKKSSVNVLVDADFEHKCFQIRLKIVQKLLEKLKDLAGLTDIQSPEDILTLLGVAETVSGIGLFAYLARRNGRPAIRLGDTDQRGMVQVQLSEGASIENLTVNNNVFMLGENKKALTAVGNAIKPIKDGEFDKLLFSEDGRSLTEIPRAEVAKIARTCEAGTTPPELPKPQPIQAHLTIRGPIFDPKETEWSFWYGDQQISADISDTDIAEKAFARGGAAVGDVYKVMLLISQYYTPTGLIRNKHKITEVLDFVPYQPASY